MEGSLLLPLGDGLLIERMSREGQQIIVSVRSTAAFSRCPLCAVASESIHSHYLRTVADLPEAGQPVILKLTVRRFFCRNALCPRRIFTERLPELVEPWAQMTHRLRSALRVLSFATCAEAGSRLAPHLGMKGPLPPSYAARRGPPLLPLKHSPRSVLMTLPFGVAALTELW
jgi:transposase